jgi:hypothetical protein
MELEQVVSQEQTVFRPKKRDAAGRDEQTQRAMDLPPREGSRELYPGSKVRVALGGNKILPPPLSVQDESYAASVAEVFAEYPRAFYHKAFKRERDAAGNIVPDGEVFPLSSADAINPGYPMPANMAQRAGIKGIVSTSEGSPAIIGQHLYRTCLVPAGWQPGDKLDVEVCRKEEQALLAAGWVHSPNDLNLPKPRTIQEESDE